MKQKTRLVHYDIQKSCEWMQVTLSVNSALRAVSNSASGAQKSLANKSIANSHSKLGLSKKKNLCHLRVADRC